MTPTPTPTPTPGDGPSRSGGRIRSSFGTDLLSDLFRDPLDPGYADAAARRRREGPPSQTRRGLGRVGTAAVLVAFGFLLSVAYQDVAEGAPEAARAREKLAAEVLRERAESGSLERRAAKLQDEVAAARDRALGSGGEAERLRDLEAATGLAKVSGPGITVTLTDAPRETDPVTGEPSGENLGRVLDRDLQRLANGLWAAGAEAIAIGGQRLSSVSTIRAAGEAILVDFTPVNGPYQVQAIGPPQLHDRFVGSRTAEQFRFLHSEYQMGFSVRRDDKLTLAASHDPRLRYAKPPKPSGSPSPTGGGD
ncbi:MAG: DUF881 domain-containing protein [Micromonosporaceae bacterium]